MTECMSAATPHAVGEQRPVLVDSRTRAKLQQGLLMIHTSRTIEPMTMGTHRADNNFAARAVEQNRMFTSRMPSTVQGIRPVVAQACTRQPTISLSSWLNMQLQDRQTPATRAQTDSHVINMEDESSPEAATPNHRETSQEHHRYHHATIADNYLNNIREASTTANQNNNNNNNNNNNENSEEEASVTVPLDSETRDLLCTLYDIFNKYLPFAMILLVKCAYDHKSDILQFLGLLLTFMSANKDLKREIAKQQNRSWKTLLSMLSYIFGCFFAMYYIFEEPMIRMYTTQSTMWELLWSVMITDMMLKLATVALKVLVTCLPAGLLPYQKRGKYYLVMEASSQFYRCTAPVYPWFFYLWDCYEGQEALIGHLFAVAYADYKFTDVVARGKLLWSALKKMCRNVSLGVSPSREQLQASGAICVICHEEYSNPVLLQCKHIFCETCVTTWLDRERTCPLCRAPISDDPIYRDGHTTDFIQWY